MTQEKAHSTIASSAIDDLEREMRIRETLIHEVHHRVKNNLQTIDSLLRMDYRRSSSPEVKRALLEASNRLRSMAVVHDMLSSSNHEELDLVQLIRNVSEQVKNGFLGPNSSFKVNVVGPSLQVDGSKATSIALVVAEITHNSFEHGFEGKDHGAVDITIEKQDSSLTITILDNGTGLPEGFSLQKSTSMGLNLMKVLVEEDLRGSIEASPNPNVVGARFCFTIPLSAIASQKPH